MVEEFLDFPGYIHRYKLERTEGLLLRHLASVYKVLVQTVPPSFKNPDLQEIEDWLAGMLRGVDSSLLDEWEKLRDPNYKPFEPKPDQTLAPDEIDITKNSREFTALVRAEIFQFLRSIAVQNYPAAAQLLPPAIASDLEVQFLPYFTEHQRLTLDPEARNRRHTYITPDETGQSWQVHQTLVDPDANNDWQAAFRVNLAASREENRAVMEFTGLATVGT
jgi:hypothetical protein